MEKIGIVKGKTIVFDKLDLPEGKKVKLIIIEKKERKIDPELEELVGLIKTLGDIEDLKEYMAKNKQLDYETSLKNTLK